MTQPYLLRAFWRYGPLSRVGSLINALACGLVLLPAGIAVAASVGDFGLLINVAFIEVVFVAIVIIVWTRRPQGPANRRAVPALRDAASGRSSGGE